MFWLPLSNYCHSSSSTTQRSLYLPIKHWPNKKAAAIGLISFVFAEMQLFNNKRLSTAVIFIFYVPQLTVAYLRSLHLHVVCDAEKGVGIRNCVYVSEFWNAVSNFSSRLFIVVRMCVCVWGAFICYCRCRCISRLFERFDRSKCSAANRFLLIV